MSWEWPRMLSDGGSSSAGLGRTVVENLQVVGWLAFLVIPVLETLGGHRALAGRVVAVGLGLAFIGLYCTMWFVRRIPWRRPEVAGAAVTLMTLDVAGLTLLSTPDWAMGFIFTACMAASTLSARLGRAAVWSLTAIAVACLLARHQDFGDVVAYGAPTFGVGVLLLIVHELDASNAELRAARSELARLAVSAERERFARDLHDLLGHSLSVIALKAELAGRLVRDDPTRARREIEEVHGVARQSLGEVRAAVGGYRRPTLEQEITGARSALDAAGVRAELSHDRVALSPEVESALAWTVREGTTNVIRHSGATCCRIRIEATLGGACVEIRDDGRGAADVRTGAVPTGAVPTGVAPTGVDSFEATVPPRGADRGTGLLGLAERSQRLGGHLEAGPLPGGGYRLAMTIPLVRSGASNAPASSVRGTR